ncbi:hypothetical protein FZC78_03135 [Rossellomorea vietnamensis]|uniref:Uncharacterized protein n=1 Tax=Rossellomorea vietnamensis TaxID=218284 RepID=A0A5D4NWB8_9BACI|nr:hypothetical protein [Rossellomorea vietnamensis]TYS18547.1 hypothetical protein FZC78_03135 [Rossellomorea vietnamensis]
MDISIGMYLMMTASHLIQVSLVMAIFSSIYIKNKRNGYISLAVIAFLYSVQLHRGFTVAPIVGITFLIIMIGMGIVSFLVIRRKKNAQLGN